LGAIVTALLVVLIASGVAVYTDVSRRRIPNAIVVPLFAVGVALQAQHGWLPVLQSLALFAVVIAAALPLYSLRVVGGGDVKFLAAACATLGWPSALYFLAYSLIAGGVIGLAVSFARGSLRSTITTVTTAALATAAGARAVPPPSAAGMMPYALAIFAGAAALTVRNIAALHLRISI
jgi:prepilin peptidase CpaA